MQRRSSFPQIRSTRWSSHAPLIAALAAGATAFSPARSYAGNSTDWMVNGGYGIGVHWTTQTVQRDGTLHSYCDAVNEFLVDVFAQQVADAGANYVLFTISHA